MSLFTIKRGDRQPSFQVDLLDGTGAAIDLTGCSVRFLMRAARAVAPKVAASAVIVDAAFGTVRWDPEAGDTDRAGTYRAEWEVTLADGRLVTVPSDGYDTVLIVADLD